MAGKKTTTKSSAKTKTISVYEALTERKIQQKRLDKLEVSTASQFDDFDIIASSCLSSDDAAIKVAENTAKSNWDTLQAVLRNIDELTAKINESNAKTMITIAGTEMSKAEAIYRYNHINTKIGIYNDLLKDVTRKKNDVDNKNQMLLRNTSEIERLVTEAIGEQGDRTYEEWIAARTAYRDELLESKKYVLVDPYKLIEKLPVLIEECDEFKEKFNLEMNKSNLVTMIDVCLED